MSLHKSAGVICLTVSRPIFAHHNYFYWAYKIITDNVRQYTLCCIIISRLSQLLAVWVHLANINKELGCRISDSSQLMHTAACENLEGHQRSSEVNSYFLLAVLAICSNHFFVSRRLRDVITRLAYATDCHVTLNSLCTVPTRYES